MKHQRKTTSKYQQREIGSDDFAIESRLQQKQLQQEPIDYLTEYENALITAPHYPDSILSDFMERRRLLSELTQINNCYRMIKQLADENLRKQKTL